MYAPVLCYLLLSFCWYFQGTWFNEPILNVNNEPILNMAQDIHDVKEVIKTKSKDKTKHTVRKKKYGKWNKFIQ